MESVWEENAKRIRFDSLEGEKRCDVLIVGGGITGILAPIA